MATYKSLGGVIPDGMMDDNTAYLLGHNHRLYIFDQPPLITAPGVGGSVPFAPGEIQHFFKPVHPQIMSPVRQPFVRNHKVRITVELNGIQHVKEFLVPGGIDPKIRGSIQIRKQRNIPTAQQLWDVSTYKVWAKSTPKIISVQVIKKPTATILIPEDNPDK